MSDNNPDVKYLFEPRGVAVIGASANTDKIGFKIVNNIVKSGYKNVYPINPKGGTILDATVYKDITEIDEEVDIATIVVPAKYTYDAVVTCAKKKVKFLSIITSGFSEVGNLEEERKIVEFSRENGMRVLGPNIFGIYSAIPPVNATFGPSDVRKGNVAIITQSGALGIAMMGKTKVEDIGLSAVVSVGNKSDIDEADLLDYLVKSEQTKVIMMYIEGVTNGERFISHLKEATKIKPVVVIKSGSSKRGAMAAASHTGSLAGADEIFTDIMKQCGVLRASGIEEALHWCKFLSNNPMPKGENCVIITNGGGIGVLAADSCENHEVELYDDFASMKQIFSGSVPDFGSVKNPIDITGQAYLEDYEKALDAALKHEDIHSVINLGCETAVLDANWLSNSLDKIAEKYVTEKPIVHCFVGGELIDKAIRTLRAKGVSIFGDVDGAVSCLGAIYRQYRNLKFVHEDKPDFDIDYEKIQEIIRNVRKAGRKFLLAHEAQQVMKAANIPFPQSRIAHNLNEAVNFSEEIGFPVVMKIVSKDIIHKSDAGGVALDLENREEVLDAYQAIMHNARNYNPDAQIEGVEVSEMVKTDVETIIGATRDKVFGPIIMFGLGGIYVEVFKDVSFRALPATTADAMSMIKETKAYPLLLGARGEEQKDIDGVIETLLKLGNILQKFESITDIEINPLIAYDADKGIKAVDVRILISNIEGGNTNE